MSSPTKTRNIYTLNDRPLVVDVGQFGNWTLDPKPEGAPFGVTVVEDRKVRVDLGNERSEVRDVTAESLVKDIVSRYSGLGLFLAEKDDQPSAKEIAQAEEEFELADTLKINEAHASWDQTHNRMNIHPEARDAARRRGHVVEWATNAIIEKKVCPFCGELIRASAVKCRFCAEFLDGRSATSPVRAPIAPIAELEPSVAVAVGGRKR